MGQYIDISMTDSLLGFMTLPVLFRQLSEKRLGRSETVLSHRFACYNTYETADRRYLAIGAVERRFWRNLCEHLNVPEFTDLQYDEDRREEITARLRTIFKEKPVARWDEEFSRVEVCHAVIREMDEVLRDPLFAQREMVVEQSQGGGCSAKTLGIPVKLHQTPGTLRTPPAGFAENTTEVLRELGFSDEIIEDYRARGIV